MEASGMKQQHIEPRSLTTAVCKTLGELFTGHVATVWRPWMLTIPLLLCSVGCGQRKQIRTDDGHIISQQSQLGTRQHDHDCPACKRLAQQPKWIAYRENWFDRLSHRIQATVFVSPTPSLPYSLSPPLPYSPTPLLSTPAHNPQPTTRSIRATLPASEASILASCVSNINNSR